MESHSMLMDWKRHVVKMSIHPKQSADPMQSLLVETLLPNATRFAVSGCLRLGPEACQDPVDEVSYKPRCRSLLSLTMKN